MKQFLKSSSFILIPVLYVYCISACLTVVQRLCSSFLHHSKITAIYYIVFISHFLFLICSLFLLYRLFVNKAKFKLLKGLFVILFALFVCLLAVHDLVDYNRLISGQIAQERRIKEFGEKILNTIKASEQKKMPDWNNWTETISQIEGNKIYYDHLSYNKNLSGVSLENLPPDTVVIAQQGNGSMTKEEFEQFIKCHVTDESFFRKTCYPDYQLLYTTNSKVVVYIKQKDEYRYFDSNKSVQVVWSP